MIIKWEGLSNSIFGMRRKPFTTTNTNSYLETTRDIHRRYRKQVILGIVIRQAYFWLGVTFAFTTIVLGLQQMLAR